MFKKAVWGSLILVIATGLCESLAVFAQSTGNAETITITTYYPAPFGIYKEMRAKRIAVGDNYINGSNFSWESSPSTIDSDADLVVEGNVGIGTTKPDAQLHVIGPVNADAFRAFESSGVYAFIEAGPNDGWADIGGFNKATISFSPVHLDGAPLVLQTRSNGNVGIGTTAPGARLQINPTVTATADYTGLKSGIIYNGGTAMTNWYGLYISAPTGTGTITNKYALITEASAGNVGIGTTNPTHLIHLHGGAYCDGTGDWITGSDRAYKKDIDYDFEYGLEQVEKLKPVYYVHKQDKTNKRQIGFIAQDVLKVVPEVVSGKEGFYGLSYGQLTAVLVKAIQEQQSQIEKQQGVISSLKSRIAKIEQRLK